MYDQQPPKGQLRQWAWKLKRGLKFFAYTIVLYALLVVMNVFMVFADLLNMDPFLEMFLSTVLIVCLIVEVAIEWIAQENYLADRWNKLDVVFCAACILVFVGIDAVIEYGDSGDSDHTDDHEHEHSATNKLKSLDNMLLVLRYTIVSVRICREAQQPQSDPLLKTQPGQDSGHRSTRAHKVIQLHDVRTPTSTVYGSTSKPGRTATAGTFQSSDLHLSYQNLSVNPIGLTTPTPTDIAQEGNKHRTYRTNLSIKLPTHRRAAVPSQLEQELGKSSVVYHETPSKEDLPTPLPDSMPIPDSIPEHKNLPTPLLESMPIPDSTTNLRTPLPDSIPEEESPQPNVEN